MMRRERQVACSTIYLPWAEEEAFQVFFQSLNKPNLLRRRESDW
jgi:hypothetical protein